MKPPITKVLASPIAREDARRRITINADRTGSCWIWDGATSRHGYGSMQVDGHSYRAHRVAFVAFGGELPDGYHVCHRCDVRNCVNPDHLFAGTNQDNMIDCARKGRCPSQQHPEKYRGENNGSSRLTESDVIEIRSCARSGVHSADLADRFGVSAVQINRIITGRKWGHVRGAIRCGLRQFRANDIFRIRMAAS